MKINRKRQISKLHPKLNPNQLTVVLLLESIVREEGRSGVRNDAQDGGPVAPVQRPRALTLPDLDKHLAQCPVAGVLVRHRHPGAGQIQRIGQRLGRNSRQGTGHEAAHFGTEMKKQQKQGVKFRNNPARNPHSLVVQVHLQQLLPLLVRRKLDRRVRNDPGHRGRVAAPQRQEALVGVRFVQEEQRRPERVRNIFAAKNKSKKSFEVRNSALKQNVTLNLLDLKVDFGAVERSDGRFGQGTGCGARDQARNDQVAVFESLVGLRLVGTGATATSGGCGWG